MLNEWRSVIEKAQTDRNKEREHIEGTKMIWEKIHKEGAVRVQYNK